ncbi:adenylate/guanylate cyclase domain-containing protein [Microbaculum marinum]|uniref:Adenylate/guanylate cyclase domain-containing protein n=1 Tax=Microbaculum marinum TaxID=1764581 RepID=A0AAW9RQZ1_9HYPH
MVRPSAIETPAAGDADASLFPLSVEEAERDAERIASAARGAAGLIIATGLIAALAFVTDTNAQTVVPRVLTALAIMAGFVALAVISFAASRASTFRPQVAYLFVLGDALLILIALHEGMYFSSHPGVLVFAQPPAWLIPIAIAIQSVRFRTGPLILAAALYIILLAALVAFAGTLTYAALPAADMGTLYSVPADAIRGLMIAITATVLVVSVRSKRDILIRGLQTARREAELKLFLPEPVSRRVSAAAGKPLAEQMTLAILFIDLQGFTRESEKVVPAEIAGWLAEFRDRVNALVLASGGFVDKFIGDGIMAIFGYESDPDAAARQVFVVLDGLPAAMRDWQAANPAAPRFNIAVGGALGPVFVGVVGSGDRREFTVIGDTVNVAARLEAFAKERSTLAAITFETARHAGVADRFEADAEQLEVRGRREPLLVCLVPRP